VVGVSFSIITVGTGALSQMYENGFCPSAEDKSKLPCPDGYGAIIATAACCSLLEIMLSFLPPKYMLRIFPPIVTGPTVMLIGIGLIESGFENWAGGSGNCMTGAMDGYTLCPSDDAPHALPWGSPQFLGLGLSVFVSIILCERFGSPIMKSTSVVLGLLVGCIIAAATGYFDRSSIDAAPVASFIWVHTFTLKVYGPLVLPMLAVFIICACEAIGDITATCDVSRLEVQGPLYESRIQGGVLADGINGCLAALCTITPMTTFAQNNGVIALTRCANRKAGYWCCFFLLVMGIFAKFAAALVAIPSSVIGGMTTFLFTSVAVSGIAIIAKGVPFNRRNRFILTASLALGYGATLVPDYFSRVFEHAPTTLSLRSFLNAIELVMETGFVITALLAMLLNGILPLEVEEGKAPSDEAASSVLSRSNVEPEAPPHVELKRLEGSVQG
jgi:uric acid-xanthine permease